MDEDKYGPGLFFGFNLEIKVLLQIIFLFFDLGHCAINWNY